MKQSHNYDHSHAHKNRSSKNIKFTLYINLVFAVVELVIGIFSNSIALISNSIHDFGDVIILLFTFNIERFSFKQRDEKFTYGYRRFTLIGVTLNSVVLLVGALLIIYGALKRILEPEIINEHILFIFAILGIIVNLIGAYKVSKDKNIVGIALRDNLLYDVLNWVILLIGSVIISVTELYILDSLLSLIVAITMLISVVKGFKEIFNRLMQAVPKDIDLELIDKAIKDTENVIDYHDLHIWDLDGEDYIATFHLVVNDNLNETLLMQIKEEVKFKLESYKINHTTIEVDTKTQAIFNKEVDKCEYKN